MNNRLAKSLITVLAFTLILTLSALLPAALNVAQGLQYGTVDISDLWYYGDSGLKIGDAKTVVDSWDKSRLSGKIIAVIDTGIDASHELFDGVLYKNSDGVEVGYDARRKQEVPVDGIGDSASDKHGNGIAGAIAILIKEFGLQDVVKIYPIKANSIDNGAEKSTFSVANVTESIKQAKRIGADAINMSLGRLRGDSAEWATNSSLKSAIIDAGENAIVVAAAGNDSKNSSDKEDNIFYPAGHDGVLGVMAYGRSGMYSGTNYGNAYGIASAGEDIYTAKYAEGTGYQYMNGTSLAAPTVAFAGALLKLRYEAEGKKAPKAYQCMQMLTNIDGRILSYNSTTVRCLDFATLLTQDFENTSYDYEDPQRIELSHNGTLGTDKFKDSIFMHASAVSPVSFVAKLQPFGKTDPDVDASITWYLRRSVYDDLVEEVELGKGMRYTLTPTVFGDTTIVARLQYGTLTLEVEQKIHIEYAPYLVGDVRVTYAKNADDGVDRAPSKGVLYTGETTVFSLTGIKYVDRTVPIKWFVNGQYVGEGVEFAYQPKRVGTFLISAQYGDMPAVNTTYVFTATVKPFVARPLDLSMLIIGICIAVAAICVVAAVVIKRKKAAKESRTENDKFVE